MANEDTAHTHGSAQLRHDHHGDEFGSTELVNALRKSFGILKLVMFVLVVLYFLSGWYAVEPGEAAVVYRFGRIVKGAGTGVNTSGWGWSWPYPIDRVEKVDTKERNLPFEFMLKLTEAERASKKIGMKFGNLKPEADDYLVTGDANVLHAALKVQYRVTEAGVLDYLKNVYDMPRERPAGVDPNRATPAYENYPEYTILNNLARNAAIETAANWPALAIRGVEQEEFINAVERRLNEKLEALEAAGTPLGIRLRENGIIAVKYQDLEAVFPPRQTQGAFDAVFQAETRKAQQLAKARSNREARLIQTAGGNHAAIGSAINKEFQLMLKIAAKGDSAGDLKVQLDEQTKKVNELLADASGDVRTIVNDARILKQSIVQDVQGDEERLRAVLPEYLKNPGVFLSRRTEEIIGLALAREGVTKMYVPPGEQIRLHIPRDDSKAAPDRDAIRDAATRVNTDDIDVVPSMPTR